jgi:hypothetical protein
MKDRVARALLVALCLLRPSIARAQHTDNPHGQLRETCGTCHRSDGWKPVTVSRGFVHAPGVFPLSGAHARTACTSCHTKLDFSAAPTKCGSCHSDVHRGELGVDCARCHTTRSFVERSAMQREHEAARFPLRGAHALATCDACHSAPGQFRTQFTLVSTTCMGCHGTSFRATKTPDHVAASFSQDCTSCHTILRWAGAKFDHANTSFVLTGAHRSVGCDGCHADKVYRTKSTQCVSCHRPAFDRTTNPAHSAGFPTSCADCHGTATWTGATFDHQSTSFPLTGAHRAVTCSGCHADKVYRGKTSDCVGCHRPDFDQTKSPPHAAAGFGTTCTTCHTTTQWNGVVFDHATTRFPLTGAHRAATCDACHADNVYRGKPSTCSACHQKEFDQTRTPPHTAAGFPNTCQTCHNTTAWPGAVFDHSATSFPLTGAHRAQTCDACHADKIYSGKPTTCVGCHQADAARVTTPPHTTFPTTCESCHNTTAWPGASFDHGTTRFPLTGAHRAVACTGCHADGVYRGKVMTCVGCHAADAARVTAPPQHTSFPTICESCHNTTAWPGATFDHSTTRFPLTGAHVTTECAGCHSDGVYHGKPTDCYACHRPAYDQTTNPGHAAAMFPTTCATCHTTTTWTGATFNHDTPFFPIYSGSHRGRWTTCADCHTAPSNFAVFTCISCHEHNKTSMDSKHAGRTGYKYESSACYACHPRGRS